MSAAAERPFPSGFDTEAALSGVAWLDRRRAEALKRFRRGGIPHRRVEEWKYSDLHNALEARRISTKLLAPPAANPFATFAGAELLIKDGCLDSRHSEERLPGGIEVLDLATLREDAPTWTKNNLGQVLKCGSLGQASLALMRGGVALRLAAGFAAPIHLRFAQREDAIHSRVLVVVEEGASLFLLESHASSGGLTNLGAEFVLGRNARLTHLRLADTSEEAIHVEEISVRAGREAKYRAHFSQTGARLSRLELTIALEQEGAEAELTGAALLSGKRHSDITTHVMHKAGKTESRQLFKYGVADHARAVYQGKITVERGADGSDSRQTAKAILLGERAEADLKPELEILADDVKCAHGAAVGDLDANSLFYLRARGIPESEARAMLLRAFLDEAVADLGDDDIRTAMWRFIDHGLSRVVQVLQ